MVGVITPPTLLNNVILTFCKSKKRKRVTQLRYMHLFIRNSLRLITSSYFMHVTFIVVLFYGLICVDESLPSAISCYVVEVNKQIRISESINTLIVWGVGKTPVQLRLLIKLLAKSILCLQTDLSFCFILNKWGISI